jgi:hypothetical protein
MPIILRILAEKSVSDDMDLARTYLGLWCDNYGEGIVEVADEMLYAETAGFRGERGVRSWRARVRRLAELGLLKVHDRATRQIGFVAILHPYRPLALLREQGKVPDGWWAILTKRLLDVGTDVEDLESLSGEEAMRPKLPENAGEASATSAVQAAWLGLEELVEQVARDTGSLGRNFKNRVAALSRNGILKLETVNSLNGLRHMRDLAIHAPAGEMTLARANQFIRLAEALAWTIKDEATHASKS